jgi:ribokinase
MGIIMKKRILVVSSANMDFVMNMHAIPSAGQTVIDSGSYRFVPGGKGANSAVAIQRLAVNVSSAPESAATPMVQF